MDWVISGTRDQYYRSLDEYAWRLANFYGNTYWRSHEESSLPLSPQELLFRYGNEYLMLKQERVQLARATLTSRRAPVG